MIGFVKCINFAANRFLLILAIFLMLECQVVKNQKVCMHCSNSTSQRTIL